MIKEKITNLFYYVYGFLPKNCVIVHVRPNLCVRLFSCHILQCFLLLAVVDLSLPDEQILNENQPDMDDSTPPENLDEEAIPMGEEFPSGI